MSPEALTPSVVLRADGGPSIGGGHIVRVRVIMQALVAAGIEAHLLTRDNEWVRSVRSTIPGNFHLLRAGENESLVTSRLVRKTGARVVVLDVRDTSEEYVQYLQETNASVITIDDGGRGARAADATFWAGQNPRDERGFHYGPDYAIMSPRILKLRARVAPPSRIERIICFLGTFDPRRHGRLIPAVAERLPKISFGWHTNETPAPSGNLQILRTSQDDFFEGLRTADAVIIAGGVVLYESAALGRPAIVLPEAPHEECQGKQFESAGAARCIMTPSVESICAAIDEWSAHPQRLAVMHAHGMALVDGRGLERLIETVRSMLEGPISPAA